jgi:hypothetical protein
MEPQGDPQGLRDAVAADGRRGGSSAEAEERPLGIVGVSGNEVRHRFVCDALACDPEQHITILSVAGPETAVKSLAATLYSDARVKFETDVPPTFGRYSAPTRHPDGYKIHRHRMDFNTWHILAVAKVEGLLPVLSEESLWQELRSDRYTTPLLRSWVPWLMEQLLESRALVQLEQVGCNAGLLRASDDVLDKLVSQGLQQGTLRID